MRRRESDLSPFRREGLLRRSAPFGVAMIIAFAALELPADELDAGRLWSAAALNLVLIAMVLLLPWERLPRTADIVPPLSYLVVVSLLRDGAGGATSGYSTLMVLPIFWLALYGTRVQLAVGVVGVAVLLGMPPLTIGEPEYPDEEWRRALIGTTVAAIVGLAVQDLVDQIRQRANALHTVSEAVGRRTHEMESRWAICEAARQVANARWVCLLEPDANARRLVTTAATSPEVEGTEAWLAAEDSPAIRSYETGRPVFIQELDSDEVFRGADGEPRGAVSGYFHPVPGRDGSLAVIAAAWDEAVRRLPETLPSVMEALTAEAAGVIERTSLILRLESAVKVDEATGLPNQRAFQEELPREISRARRSGKTLSVALLDVGEFERDADGQLSSQDRRTLRNLADRWKRLVGPTDLLAALDPGRFGLVLPELDESAARDALRRLEEAAPPERRCIVGVATWDRFELPAALVGRAETELQLERATASTARD